jgi:transcriptional regulator with XRE-family HTH domain
MENEQTRHHGKSIRAIRQLRGMKQDTFAKKLGMSQQNVSKMENKKTVNDEQLQNVAKVLDVTANMVKTFDEKVVVNNNFLFNDQIINPVKEIIAYFKEELKRELTEKDKINLELEKVKAELEEYKKGKRKSAKPKEAKLKSMPGKQAVQ